MAEVLQIEEVLNRIFIAGENRLNTSGSAPSGDYLLLETGDGLLLETGNSILLEGE